MAHYYTPFPSTKVKLNAALLNERLGQLDAQLARVVDGMALWQELGSDPASPLQWALYFKSGGLYQMDSSSAVSQILTGGLTALTRIGSGRLTAIAGSLSMGLDTGYSHALIIFGMRSDAAAPENILLTLNGDTNTSSYYSRESRFVNTFSDENHEQDAAGMVLRGVDNTAPASYRATYAVLLPTYLASNHWKRVLWWGYAPLDDLATDMSVQVGGGTWRSNTQVASVTLTPEDGNNVMVGSYYEVWGIA